MRYSKVYLSSFGYELPPNVITSDDLESRLTPLYEALHFQKGQLEALTGIRERRYWDAGFRLSDGATKAAEKALETSDISRKDIGMLIYGGVCRENLEPATACAVANNIGLGADTQIYDISNACLGVVNGMVQVANAIELGQIKAGMIVSCESSRQIVEMTIDRLLTHMNMDVFKKTIATLTGGSGAIAVILTDDSFAGSGHKLEGGIIKNATEHHELCRWGPDSGVPASAPMCMETDSVGVLQNGVALGIETFSAFKSELSLADNDPDKIICHQVGAAHQKAVLDAIRVPAEKDFTTFQYLGNIGTVSLPMTAAIADERDFFDKGDFVAFCGIGSGLNCLILGIRW
ncbi:MAG: 3-oxoacyl-ACP synthase III [Desulfobacterales bacterium]|nr:3-oxoacyl-ACP synthase III [Desulfobacterales bacterium]